ncbi:regulator of G-protein signaling 1 [Mus musculus]|uniref:Regulator of G-protein signaling 1 n=2 Tax=Mus musculus TaxID=10090 RepID=RGS1_MOUSE|nr:regulator of G-protein signaling 1 [Mus musculus]Q9JL25.2 RecName: Full=Regulator of G-protein signaling 1; Short=RGS1 [Mus musculus]EDL39503.1 regulator of G-protein signaling 1, isoform CRA_c [Mus musculus]|eukprot:NP_056626.2 regulator of G-protein signaling 1 [Mus musculus]
MRAAAISMPRLNKMPGMFFSASPKDSKEHSHSLLDDKKQKKRPKTFGMDVKTYLRSMIPHLESGMKSAKSKDILSAEEVMQWSQSLEKLLANQTGQNVFGRFLKSEFSEENIEFWLACEDYKKTETDLLHNKAENIYKAFVHSDAVKQINIDFHTRESTAKKIKTPTPTSFDEAQKVIYSLMEKDSYPRFLKSNIYLNLLNDLQANTLK